jgi:hypothetical protein
VLCGVTVGGAGGRFTSGFRSFHHSRHPPASGDQPPFKPLYLATLPATSTSLAYRYMLDELQFRKTSANYDSLLPRTIYLPELDMEIVIPPPVQVPRRELPSNTIDINSRVKLLRTSVAFGGVSFPKPCPLPKPPR